MRHWIATAAKHLSLIALAAPACGDYATSTAEPTDDESSAIVAAARDPIMEFGLPTVPEGPLGPFDIVTGGDGNIWFSTGQLFLGRLLPENGSVSLIPIPSGASRIARGPDGNIWFGTAAGVARVSVHHQHSTREIPIPGLGPVSDLTAGPDGNLWVMGFGNIARVRLNGQTKLFPIPILEGTSNQDHLVAGPDGNLWFNGGIRMLHRMTLAGVVTDYQVNTPGSIFGLAAGTDGAVWFTQIGGGPNENSIGRITPAGVVSTVVQLPTSTSVPPDPPENMAIDLTAGPGGNMYFTTYFVQPLNYIGQVSRHGVLTKFDIPTAGAASFGITAGPDGTVWFTEIFNNLIGRLTPPRGHHHDHR